MTSGMFIAYSAGSALAKYIAKAWIGNDFLDELADELVDFLRSTGEESTKQTQQSTEADKLACAMATRMQQVYDYSTLTENSKRSVAIEVATALAKTHTDVEIIIASRMDPNKLADAIIRGHSLSTTLFSDDEVAFYRRLISEAARAQVHMSSLLESFTGAFAAKLLKDNELIVSLIEKLLQEPDDEVREFQYRYKEIVKRKLDRLEVFGIPQLNRYSSQQSLSIAYISLDAEPQEFDSKFIKELYSQFENTSPSFKLSTEVLNLTPAKNHLRNALLHFSDIHGETFHAVLKTSESNTNVNVDTSALMKNFLASRSNSIEAILAKKRRIVVQGQAGSGKTTLLQWLAVRSASEDFESLLSDWNTTIPFFIRLREYVDIGFPTPQEFPEKIAPSFAGAMPHGWVHHVLDSGLGLILVDGVDELPFAQRDEMLSHLADLVQTYPASRYVVSSRPAALKEQLWPKWKEWVNEEGFTTTTLRDMDSVLVATFIDQWHEALAATTQEKEEQALIRGHVASLKSLLNGRPPLRRLAKNPLLCAMICALYQERQQNLPSERLKLYEECVEMLLTRRDEGRKITTNYDYPSLSLSQRLSLIQDLSYWMMSNGYSDVETAVAEDRFGRRLPSLGIPNATSEQVRRLFCERTNLLREPIIGRIDFTHLTFQEYLSAKEAVEEGDFGVLSKHVEDDKWREVIVLAVGIARQKEREDFLRSVVAKSLRRNISYAKRKQIALLALACLETSVSLSPILRDEILSNASSAIPPSDDDESKLVASAGDPAVSLLAPQSSYTNDELTSCIKTLAMIGSETAMMQLSAFADYKRPIVQRALVSAWDSFDQDRFAQIVLKDVDTISINKRTHLQGLHHLQHLSTLFIQRYSPKDSELAELSALPKLKELTISLESGLPDLTSLGKIKSLQKLALRFGMGTTELTSFDQIGLITQLTHLSVTGATISASIEPLAQISNLSELTIGTICGQGATLQILHSLKSLKRLEIQTHKIEIEVDLRHFSNLLQLKTLIIRSRIVPDSFDVLANFTNLTELSIPIRGDHVNLSFLSFLSLLNRLTLYLNTTPNFVPLATLPNLRNLKLISDTVISLDTIFSLKNLTHLDITECKVTDLKPLTELTGLKHLKISKTKDIDLSMFENRPEIEIESTNEGIFTDMVLKHLKMTNPHSETFFGDDIDFAQLVSSVKLDMLNSNLLEYLSNIKTTTTIFR